MCFVQIKLLKEPKLMTMGQMAVKVFAEAQFEVWSLTINRNPAYENSIHERQSNTKRSQIYSIVKHVDLSLIHI